MTNSNTEKSADIKSPTSKLDLISMILAIVALSPLLLLSVIGSFYAPLVSAVGMKQVDSLTHMIAYFMLASIPSLILALISIKTKATNRSVSFLALFISASIILYFVIGRLFGPLIIAYFLKGVDFSRLRNENGTIIALLHFKEKGMLLYFNTLKLSHNNALVMNECQRC